MATARLSRETANEMGITTKSLGRTKTSMKVSEFSNFTCNTGQHVQQPISGIFILLCNGARHAHVARMLGGSNVMHGVYKKNLVACLFSPLFARICEMIHHLLNVAQFFNPSSLSKRRFNLFTWIAPPELHLKNAPSGGIWHTMSSHLMKPRWVHNKNGNG